MQVFSIIFKKITKFTLVEFVKYCKVTIGVKDVNKCFISSDAIAVKNLAASYFFLTLAILENEYNIF